MPEGPKITFDHCVVAASEWERSNRFYHEVLGAELVRQGARWAYRFGEVQVNLHGPGVSGVMVARLPVPPGGSDLCFEWHGPIAEAQAHLARHGVVVEKGPVPRSGARGAGRSLYFRDPDGTLLEFISYQRDEAPSRP